MTDPTPSGDKPVREITSHRVNPATDTLVISVLDEPGSGGACHLYRISGYSTETNPSDFDHVRGEQPPEDGVDIIFQNGPIAEVGVNGVTHEALLAILIDRMEAFQAGPFKCDENAVALHGLKFAQRALHGRTARRMQQGVEGTHEPDAGSSQ